MKNYRIPCVLILAVSILAVVSCTKKANDVTQVLDGLSTQRSIVQVYNGILNSSRNFVYVNGQPANGATVAFGAAFPSSAYGFAVWGGDNSYIIKDTLATTTQATSSFILNTKPGSSYSIFMYDTITSPKRLVVENNFIYNTGNFGNIRFVNLIYSPTATPNVDLFSVNQNAVIAYSVPVGGASSYISIPATTSDTWQVRQTGTSNVLATVTISSSTIAPQRSYTAVFRGSYNVSANRGINVIANN